MDFCSFFFVCTSYKSTFLNRSDNTWRHLRLHILPPFRLPPPFQRHISLAEWLHRLASPHSHVRVCVTNTRVYMRPSSGRFSTCFVLSALTCVFTAAWLRIPDISFFAINMGPSSATFSARFVVSAHSRVCVRLSLHIFRTFRSSLLQHTPRTSVLSPIPTSAHAFTVTIMSSFSLYQKITPYIRFRNW